MSVRVSDEVAMAKEASNTCGDRDSAADWKEAPLAETATASASAAADDDDELVALTDPTRPGELRVLMKGGDRPWRRWRRWGGVCW